MKIRNQERKMLREGKGMKARRKMENKIVERNMAKKYMYVELVSEVASGLVPALKQRH